MPNTAVQLRQLTIRARVAAAEHFGRVAMSELDESHPGFAFAKRALDLVAAWQQHPQTGGAVLLEALLNDHDEGVFAFVDARTPLPTDYIFNLVGGAVSLAAWHAFRLAGEALPEGFEEDEECLLHWLVEQAALSPQLGSGGAVRAIGALAVKHLDQTGNQLGEPVIATEGA